MAESWLHVDMIPLGEFKIASWRLYIKGDSRQMLSTWLRKNYNVKQFGEPTWAKLVEVIKYSAGGENPLLP